MTMNSRTKSLLLAVALLLCSGCVRAPIPPLSMRERARVTDILHTLPHGLTMSQRINLISGQLLNTPYLSGTLDEPSTIVDGAPRVEKFVVRFDTVDCTTFVELVRALTLSHDVPSFVKTLIRTRYRDARIAFDQRRHFLSDWWAYEPFNGIFSDVSGKMTLDAHAPTNSKLSVVIPVSEVRTTSKKLDDELKGNDWLDASRFPNASFVSSKVEPTGPADAKVSGILTLHGVSHPETLQVHFIGAGINPLDKKYTVGFEGKANLRV